MSDPDARLDTYADNTNERRRNMRRAMSTMSMHSQASGSSAGSAHTPDTFTPTSAMSVHSDEDGIPDDNDGSSADSPDSLSESERHTLAAKRKRRDVTSDEDNTKRPLRRRRKNESAFARFESAPAKLAVHPKVSEHLLGLDRLHHLKTPFSTVPLTNLTRYSQEYAFHKEVQTLKTATTVFNDVIKGSRDVATLATNLKSQQANLDNADEMALVGFKANVLAAHLLQELTDKLDEDQAFPNTLITEVRNQLKDTYDIDIDQPPPKKAVKAEVAVPPVDGAEPPTEASPAPKPED
ncbi:hypothetical protein HDU93_004199 [Gonapodya sp. JEL0774]|nr:hypothetical protein HDU93_004199 [Gonapodya sp. JEL0774]